MATTSNKVWPWTTANKNWSSKCVAYPESKSSASTRWARRSSARSFAPTSFFSQMAHYSKRRTTLEVSSGRNSIRTVKWAARSKIIYRSKTRRRSSASIQWRIQAARSNRMCSNTNVISMAKMAWICIKVKTSTSNLKAVRTGGLWSTNQWLRMRALMWSYRGTTTVIKAQTRPIIL